MADPVQVAVLHDEGEPVLAVRVTRLDPPCCLAAQPHWHSVQRFQDGLADPIGKERRDKLASASGWCHFAVAQTQHRRVFASGISRKYMKRAKTLALIAAVFLDDKASWTLMKSILGDTTVTVLDDFLRLVAETWRIQLARPEMDVEYKDTDGREIQCTLKGGYEIYLTDPRLQVQHPETRYFRPSALHQKE